MKIQVTACDQCGKTIADGARRIGLVVCLSIINGHERTDQRTFPDLCGEQCAHEALTALTRAVEEIGK